MLCLRCMRAVAGQTLYTASKVLRQIPQSIANPTRNSQKRSLSILSRVPTRPSLFQPSIRATIAPVLADTPTSSLQPLAQPSTALLQVRGAIRDTYDPSHRIRKRRHGFLSRIRTKNGKKLIKRRRLKRRNTMSH